MDWTLDDNMVDGLFFCATLTSRRGGHTSFVQAGAETSDTGAEAVERGCIPVSGINERSLVDCPPIPRSIDDPPTAPHVCCCCQIK